MPSTLVRLVQTGLCHFAGLADQPFFVLIVETKQPGGATFLALADHVIQMTPIPALPAGVLPFPLGIDLGGGYTQKGLVGQRGDPGLAGGFPELPLVDDELDIISPLGIADEQQQ